MSSTPNCSPEHERDLDELRRLFEAIDDRVGNFNRLVPSLRRTAPAPNLDFEIVAEGACRDLVRARDTLRHLLVICIGEPAFLRLYDGGYHARQDGEL